MKRPELTNAMLWIITALLSLSTYFVTRMISENDKTKDAVLELRVDVAVIKTEIQKITEEMESRHRGK